MTPEITTIIQQCAASYGLPFGLLTAQVDVESSGNPWALRYEPGFFARYIQNNPMSVGAQYGPFAACSVGLLQIMVEVAYEIGYVGRPEGLFSPRVGLSFGCKRMQALWKEAGGAESAYPNVLASYNGGPRWLTVPAAKWPTDVHAYVDRVYALAS